MSNGYFVGIPEDIESLIRKATDPRIPDGIDVPMSRRIRYIVALHFGVDSGRAFQMLMSDLPRPGRPPRKARESISQ